MKNPKSKRHSDKFSKKIDQYLIFRDGRTSLRRFRAGDVYLFHRYDRRCPSRKSLWGIFDKQIDTSIYLESSSKDLRKFELWHKLSADYKFCRLATRAELRDFMFALALYEKNS